MNQSDSGWRKRQIALEIKAENARELGLDYEPTIIEMAREAGAIEMRDNDSMGWGCEFELYQLEAFAALVRADEREACAKVVEKLTWADNMGVASAIRARSKHE
jgi:hypothetical protein